MCHVFYLTHQEDCGSSPPTSAAAALARQAQLIVTAMAAMKEKCLKIIFV
jgi:hypothetical protein